MSEEKEILTEGEESRASIADDIRAAMAELESDPAQQEAAAEAAPTPDAEPSKGGEVGKGGEAAEVHQLKKDLTQSEGKAPNGKSGPSATQNLDSIPAPISWSTEKRQAFQSLPKDVQQYIVEREKDSQRLISQKSEEYDRTIKGTKEVLDVLEPYKQNFAQRGVSEREAIQYLLQANDFLEKNPKEAIRRLAQMNGIDLAEVAQEPETIDPQIQHLSRELDSLKGFISHQQQTAQQQYISQLGSYLESFENATDESGEKKYPYIAEAGFEDLMATEVTRLRRINPQMNLDHILHTAYENTVWLQPQLREAEIAKRSGIAEARRISEEKAKAAEARKRGISVTGSPSGAAKPLSTGSIRGDLEAAFEALGR